MSCSQHGQCFATAEFSTERTQIALSFGEYGVNDPVHKSHWINSGSQSARLAQQSRKCLYFSSAFIYWLAFIPQIIKMLKCDVFSDIRVDYINNIMRNNADFINFNLEQKFTFLITKYWRETLNFLCKAWSKRKTCLYL